MKPLVLTIVFLILLIPKKEYYTVQANQNLTSLPTILLIYLLLLLYIYFIYLFILLNNTISLFYFFPSLADPILHLYVQLSGYVSLLEMV